MSTPATGPSGIIVDILSAPRRLYPRSTQKWGDGTCITPACMLVANAIQQNAGQLQTLPISAMYARYLYWIHTQFVCNTGLMYVHTMAPAGDQSPILADITQMTHLIQQLIKCAAAANDSAILAQVLLNSTGTQPTMAVSSAAVAWKDLLAALTHRAQAAAYAGLFPTIRAGQTGPATTAPPSAGTAAAGVSAHPSWLQKLLCCSPAPGVAIAAPSQAAAQQPSTPLAHTRFELESARPSHISLAISDALSSASPDPRSQRVSGRGAQLSKPGSSAAVVPALSTASPAQGYSDSAQRSCAAFAAAWKDLAPSQAGDSSTQASAADPGWFNVQSALQAALPTPDPEGVQRIGTLTGSLLDIPCKGCGAGASLAICRPTWQLPPLILPSFQPVNSCADAQTVPGTAEHTSRTAWGSPELPGVDDREQTAPDAPAPGLHVRTQTTMEDSAAQRMARAADTQQLLREQCLARTLGTAWHLNVSACLAVWRTACLAWWAYSDAACGAKLAPDACWAHPCEGDRKGVKYASVGVYKLRPQDLGLTSRPEQAGQPGPSSVTAAVRPSPWVLKWAAQYAAPLLAGVSTANESLSGSLAEALVAGVCCASLAGMMWRTRRAEGLLMVAHASDAYSHEGRAWQAARRPASVSAAGLVQAVADLAWLRSWVACGALCMESSRPSEYIVPAYRGAEAVEFVEGSSLTPGLWARQLQPGAASAAAQSSVWHLAEQALRPMARTCGLRWHDASAVSQAEMPASPMLSAAWEQLYAPVEQWAACVISSREKDAQQIAGLAQTAGCSAGLSL